jgi:hypothetical protein
MASLVVDRVKCVEESNESGSDDVYMVVFRGNTTAPFESNVGVHAPGIWRDFDTGEVENNDRTIAKFVPGAVYVVMLVEEDNDRDIAGGVIDMWKAQLALTWTAQMIAGASPANAAQAIGTHMKGLASVFMEFPYGNDDILGIKRVSAAPGMPQERTFKWDGSHYIITFKVI